MMKNLMTFTSAIDAIFHNSVTFNGTTIDKIQKKMQNATVHTTVFIDFVIVEAANLLRLILSTSRGKTKENHKMYRQSPTLEP